MTIEQHKKFRLYFTAAMALLAWATLMWQFTHDGVASHYLLHNKDLPSISNWWGGIVIPLLSWTLIGRINTRLAATTEHSQNQVSKSVIVGFVAAALYGAAMSVSFTYGFNEINSVLFPGIFVLGLFFKIYREECILGFILSMCIVFGAVLPLIFSVVFAVSGAVLYHLVRYILSLVGLTSAKN